MQVRRLSAVLLGTALGAALAGARIDLRQATCVLPLGIVLGGVVMGAAFTHELLWALPSLLLCGAIGGALVVPMNALLQHRGLRR